MTAIDYEIGYVPKDLRITFQATGLTDKALTVKVTDLNLDRVVFTPKSASALLLKPAADALAPLAPPIVKKKVIGMSSDVPLDKPIGTEITISGQTVSVRLGTPELGSHDGMLMVSGTAVVS
ncbi:hypothetical protein [Streptomyces sioyaensis]|uniref:hypothetical protein n=1 Tax=Streptomyces sioyaensis TaxID=67364 RepID=UPI00379B1E29